MLLQDWYCNALLSGLLKTNITQLELLQNLAAHTRLYLFTLSLYILSDQLHIFIILFLLVYCRDQLLLHLSLFFNTVSCVMTASPQSTLVFNSSSHIKHFVYCPVWTVEVGVDFQCVFPYVWEVPYKVWFDLIWLVVMKWPYLFKSSCYT